MTTKMNHNLSLSPGEIHENHYYGTITRFRLTRS